MCERLPVSNITLSIGVYLNRSSKDVPRIIHVAFPLRHFKITEEEIERIMSGQEFKEEAPDHTWGNNGDSDHSSPSNGVLEGNQPSPASTLSSKWVVHLIHFIPKAPVIEIVKKKSI